MANSFVQYTATGATDLFGVTFPFISRTHVTVTIDDVVDVFAWINDGSIQTSVTPTAGQTVLINRVTPSIPLTDFKDASTLGEDDLDRATLQALYVSEETADNIALAISGSGNVPGPANPTDNNKVLTATGGLFGWFSFLSDWISDATAFGRSLLKLVDVDALKTVLSLGTASTKDTGTSGDVVPVLNQSNVFDSEFTTFRFSDDVGGAGPEVIFDRDDPSPTDGDSLGRLRFNGRNSVGETVEYAGIRPRLVNTTDGAESGELEIDTVWGGVSSTVVTIGSGVQIGSPGGGNISGSLNVDGGVYDDGKRISANGTVKSWILFQGTGTVTIQDDYQVSTVTDNGTGDYTINFTITWAHTSYVGVGMASDSGGGVHPYVVSQDSATAPTTGAFRVNVTTSNAIAVDSGRVYLMFIGDV